VPNNPIKELDEIYIKDEKRVTQFSLEKINLDRTFNQQIEALKPEMKALPPVETQKIS